MVDSIKDRTSPSSSEALRKNLKAITTPPTPTQQADFVTHAVNSVTDAVHLSADALNKLGKQPDQTRYPQVAEENLDASTATPEDVTRVKEEADKTGVAIQFRPSEALFAHGDRLNYDHVVRLLSD